MAKIKDRLVSYLKYSNISKQEFCKITGISYPNMVGKSLESEFGGEQLSEIVMKFHNISPDWLLTGKGEMLRENPENVSQNGQNVMVENSGGRKNNTAVAAAPRANAACGSITIQPSAEVLALINAQQATIAQQAATISNLSEVISRYVQRIDNE